MPRAIAIVFTLLTALGPAVAQDNSRAAELQFQGAGDWQQSFRNIAASPAEQLLLGQRYREQGAYWAAIESLLQLHAKWPQAREAQEALITVSDIYYSLSMYRDMHDTLDLYLSVYANQVPLPKLQQQFLFLAKYYLDQADLDDGERQVPRGEAMANAQKLVEQLYELDRFGPFADQALYQLGLIKIEQGDYLEAIEHLKRLLSEHKQSPLRPQAEVQIAVALLALNPHPERTSEERIDALQRLERAELEAQRLGITLEPKLSEVREKLWNIEAERWYRQGNIWAKLDRYPAAAAAYRMVVERYPTSERAPSAQRRLDRALRHAGTNAPEATPVPPPPVEDTEGDTAADEPDEEPAP